MGRFRLIGEWAIVLVFVGLGITCATLLAVVGEWLNPPASAVERRAGCYDGDTCRLTWRLANVDTPEIDGKCALERGMAAAAQAFAERWIGDWRGLVIRTDRIDRYGRVLVLVSRDGRDLGEALIVAGLAREWRGRREGWCDGPQGAH